MKQSNLTPEDQALGDALCAKLRQLAAVSPPTPRSLLQVEQTARMAREILVAITDPFAMRKPPHHLPMPMQVSPGYMGAIGPNVGSMVGGFDEPLPYTSGEPQGSSYQENFGAEALRLIAEGDGKGEGEKPAQNWTLETVAAIKMARDNGMHELADKLEGQLLEGNAALFRGMKPEPKPESKPEGETA